MTNREKLASMTDKELAEYVCNIDRMCSSCPGSDLCVFNGGHGNGMIKWLQAEAEDEQ